VTSRRRREDAAVLPASSSVAAGVGVEKPLAGPFGVAGSAWCGVPRRPGSDDAEVGARGDGLLVGARGRGFRCSSRVCFQATGFQAL
jgi:hypothetical protein